MICKVCSQRLQPAPAAAAVAAAAAPKNATTGTDSNNKASGSSTRTKSNKSGLVFDNEADDTLVRKLESEKWFVVRSHILR